MILTALVMSWETTSLKPQIIEVEFEGKIHKGRNLKAIFSSVHDEYIRQARIAPPGWEEDVWVALREKYPRYILKRVRKDSRAISVASVTAFVNYLISRGFSKKLVSTQEAQRRADICAQCPAKTHIVGCKICKNALKMTVKPPVKIQAPEGCSVCNCYIPLKIWIPKEHLQDSKDQFDFPDNCWIHD